MPAERIAFSTPLDKPRWQRWLLYSPGARILWFLLLVAGIGLAVQSAFSVWGWRVEGPMAPPAALLTAQLLPALLAYLAIVFRLERRRAGELAWRDLPSYGLGGLAAGLALFSVVVLVLWLADSYHVDGTRAQVDWLHGVVIVGFGAAVAEEILLRGVLYRMVEEGLGTWSALLVSAAIFGALHLGNPYADPWSAIAIMIEAGILLALLYHVTRSLWACIGLHAGWNIVEGTVYGIPVSGSTAEGGWLDASLSGPDWLTGGSFGAETSVVAVAVCLLPSIALLAIAVRRGSLVSPSWRRRVASPVQVPRSDSGAA
ncbi:type II CAAX endopeptidase family protein [Thermomonas sp.]|uniref:CPBP family intramembrane glutamic endopeptidase n=1 Tax=Thermomonas sp. TaxID=1971895 RepID=UPI002B5AF674|nr:type II CAAX endopeptidase family protein [Thermomonas sp.]HRO63358.1 type II CAAX endopeptidase family protein [Thermomonas sp.]